MSSFLHQLTTWKGERDWLTKSKNRWANIFPALRSSLFFYIFVLKRFDFFIRFINLKSFSFIICFHSFLNQIIIKFANHR